MIEPKISTVNDEESLPDKGSLHSERQYLSGQAITTAHLYRGMVELLSPLYRNNLVNMKTEDSHGRVLAKLFSPRPTNNPRDPLVSGVLMFFKAVIYS